MREMIRSILVDEETDEYVTLRNVVGGSRWGALCMAVSLTWESFKGRYLPHRTYTVTTVRGVDGWCGPTWWLWGRVIRRVDHFEPWPWERAD